MGVAKPATQRPKLPSVGRLGLVEPHGARRPGLASGWNTDAHVELLWSLSRAPDADIALRAMVRLAEALGDETGTNSTTALLKDRGLRGRLFAVLGSSLALGDHLVANPRLVAPAGRRRHAADAAASCGRRSPSIAERSTGAAAAMPPLRTLYRDRLLVLAGLDLAPDGGERTGAAVHRRSVSISPTWPTPRWTPR